MAPSSDALLLIPPTGYAVHGFALEVRLADSTGPGAGALGPELLLWIELPELQLSTPPRLLTRWALENHPTAPLHAILELWHALEERQAQLILAGGSAS